MGGKSIKIAERVSKETFFKYAEQIIPRVEKSFGTEVSMVNSFYNKNDFGDIDLLVLVNRDFGNRRKIIEDEFSPDEMVTNGNLISFNFNELQVDLIFTPENNWETSKIFFEWGDLGNLMGKMINNYGYIRDKGFSLKYGYDGLKMKILHEGKSRKFFLTKNNEDVFNFLGLSFERWKEGFYNVEEVFDYVIGSKYFDPESFQWENLSSINKHRNKRRPNYNKFLEYIEPLSEGKPYDWNEPLESYINKLDEFFGVDIYSEYNKLLSDIEHSKTLRDKFNGKLVMSEFPELKGSELGNQMKSFKDSRPSWDEYIINSSKEDIMSDFRKHYLSK